MSYIIWYNKSGVVLLAVDDTYIIVSDIEGNIRIYRLSKGRGTDQLTWYCPSQRIGNIIFMVRSRTPGQSVYLDVVNHISIYCVYCIEIRIWHTQYKYTEMFSGIKKANKNCNLICWYRPVAPVYARFLDRSISASQSVLRNNEGRMESGQLIKCMLFILIWNKNRCCIFEAMLIVVKAYTCLLLHGFILFQINRNKYIDWLSGFKTRVFT